VIFTETKLKGAFIIDLDRKEDGRGFFARTFCKQEFKAHGLKPLIAQANAAHNRKKGTIRGMHFQYPPAAEAKLVRCTRGAILDIIVDLRPDSDTFLQHVAVELNEGNQRALYVPERFAHGYQVLRDDTDTSYQVGEFYTPSAEGGLMYNEFRLGLDWPLPVTVVSDKDKAFPPLDQIGLPLKAMPGIRLESGRWRQERLWRGRAIAERGVRSDRIVQRNDGTPTGPMFG
jgi:dTDP-4-dehydrorhamnose 3,5-epimerase